MHDIPEDGVPREQCQGQPRALVHHQEQDGRQTRQPHLPRRIRLYRRGGREAIERRGRQQLVRERAADTRTSRRTRTWRQDVS